MVYNVYFDERSAIPVEDKTPDSASIRARFMAWVVTGQWKTVLKVEPIAGSMITHLAEAT
jgi:hypothetical protein